MNFVSFQFGVFMVLVLVLYWRLPPKARNGFLLLSSWVFYAAWDWRFLGLIVLSTVVDFVAGGRIHRLTDTRRRRAWRATSSGTSPTSPSMHVLRALAIACGSSCAVTRRGSSQVDSSRRA